MNRREFKLTYTTTSPQFGGVCAEAQGSAILNLLPKPLNGTFTIELLSEQVLPTPGSKWLSKSKGFDDCTRVHAHVFEVLNNQVFFRYQERDGEWFHHKCGVPWFLENYTPASE